MSNLSNRVKKLEDRIDPNQAPLIAHMYPGETEEKAIAIAAGGKPIDRNRLVVVLTHFAGRRSEQPSTDHEQGAKQ